jgi:hypothetical protein
MSDPLNLQRISVTGPGWLAELDVATLDAPERQQALRTLFVDRTPRTVGGQNNVLAPGTLLLLGIPRSVELRLSSGPEGLMRWTRPAQAPLPNLANPAALKTALHAGQVCLLLVVAEAGQWPKQARGPLPGFTCVAGEIALDLPTLVAQGDGRSRLYKGLTLSEPAANALQGRNAATQALGAARLVSPLAVHAGGLSLLGAIHLPWLKDTERVAGVFQLTRLFATPEDTRLRFRLSIELERLTASETSALIDAWQALSALVNPAHPLNRAPASSAHSPRWVTLELRDPSAAPRLYWTLESWQAAPPSLPLFFAQGEIALLLSDRQPYDGEQPPGSLARLLPAGVTIGRKPISAPTGVNDNASSGLVISLGATPTPVANSLSYRADAETLAGVLQWQEQIDVQEHELAYEPGIVAQLLRDAQQIATPTERPDPPLLWGAVALADGWLQLPVPNLTAQLYVDAGLARRPATLAQAQLQGAVSFANTGTTVEQYPAQQPWSLTLVDAQTINAEWVFPGAGEGFRPGWVRLVAHEPQLVLNGLLWMSTSPPTAADALPDFDNWVNGLQALSLRSLRSTLENNQRTSTDPFPVALNFALPRLQLRPGSPEAPGSAELGSWELRYGANTALIDTTRDAFAALFNDQLLPAQALAAQPTLAWRRHPGLPMVQALALTQSNLPPNVPSANRQLLPFALPVAANGRPDDWRIGSSAAAGAQNWPQLLSATRPHAAWWQTDGQALADLPMAALSIPGLHVDPAQTDGAVSMPAGWPAGSYRFDLPYTDEVHALASVPKTPRDPREVSPLPDDPPQTPPQPLDPTRYLAHWQRLAEQASLARGAATDGLVRTGNEQFVRGLVEPYDWPVRLEAQTAHYPGGLAFANAGGTEPLDLPSPEAQLKGLSGHYVIEQHNGQQQLRQIQNEQANALLIEAGSMQAQRTENGSVRDQRGLLRRHTSQHGSLLATPLTFEETSNGPAKNLTLLATLTACELQVGKQRWQLWFRDLPIWLAGSDLLTGAFIWQNSHSPRSEDVNDPEAVAREYNHLSGYEWRLGGATAGGSFFKLYGLDLYPLRLEHVALANGKIKQVVIYGRLQLPLSKQVELSELGNMVALTFTAEGDEPLELQAVALVQEEGQAAVVGEWPLSTSGGELDDAPRLIWPAILLSEQGLQITSPRLEFFLFDTAWSVPCAPLTFPEQGEKALDVQYTQAKPAAPTYAYLAELKASLDLNTRIHKVSLTIALSLGRANAEVSFSARVELPLLNGDSAEPRWLTGNLFSDLAIAKAGEKVAGDFSLVERSFQFAWAQCAAENLARLQVLPGMHLASGALPGCAVLLLAVAPGQNGIPNLTIDYGFVEAQLAARWGTLRSEAANQLLSEADLAQSSAGDLSVGYTGYWLAMASEVEEQLLFNGMLELSNLISWPAGLTYDEPANTLLVPALRGEGSSTAHTRHHMRLLLNQLSADHTLLEAASGDLLFQLRQGKSWQFLGVAEHQFVALQPQADGYLAELVRRWTLVQEVRLLRPADLASSLQQLAAANTLDPVRGLASVEAHGEGAISPAVRPLLIEELNKLALAQPQPLIVEASAAHWVRQTPLQPTRPIALQYLPGGSQHGALSNPADYGPGDPFNPEWLLFSVPVLGRLQEQSANGAASSPAERRLASPLVLDPLLLLLAQAGEPAGRLHPLALMLVNRADRHSGGFALSPLESERGRRFARLDPTALEENWLRLQTPPAEDLPERLPSVSAALPDTPARLSRSAGLNGLYDVFRPSYPPAARNEQAPPLVADVALLWRPESILLPQRVGEARTISGLVALYNFDEGQGEFVRDRSGVGTPLDLVIEPIGNARWLPGGGLAISTGGLVRSIQKADKILTRCRETNEISIELWLQPAQATLANPRTPGRILALSQSYEQRNVTVQQGTLNGTTSSFFNVRLRRGPVANNNSAREGEPALISAEGSLTTSLTHVVYTRSASGQSRLYINGREVASQQVAGNFAQWEMNDIYLCLANEKNFMNRPWQGSFHFVAIYNRALSADLVRRQYVRRSSNIDAPWALTGMLLNTLGNAPAGGGQHAAATLLPARLSLPDRRAAQAGQMRKNPVPLTFAVSPYVQLAYRPLPAQATTSLALLAAELITFEPQTRTLRSSAVRVWDSTQTGDLDQRAQSWANEVYALNTSDSPVALLRLREIRIVQNPLAGEALVITAYRFRLLMRAAQPQLTRRVARLRTTVSQLHFREGQFGGTGLPEAAEPFELAPPQPVGVQPLYIEQRPDGQRSWPWGLSALRLAVRYTANSEGVLGGVVTEAPPPTPAAGEQATARGLRLWWQAVGRRAQFRASTSDTRPLAGLPHAFRAEAVASLLPSPPQPQLPAVTSLRNCTVEWQPVLPGSLRYVLHGPRPGFFFALRHQLISQPLQGDAPMLVSGSLPVQHRAPRPLPLPANLAHEANSQLDAEASALQPWASYFAPQVLLHARKTPLDEAFFAASKPGQGGQINPGRGLRLHLINPARGLINSEWLRPRAEQAQAAGELELQVEMFSTGAGWEPQIELAIIDGAVTIPYGEATRLEPAGNRYRWQLLSDAQGKNTAALEQLQQLLAGKPIGSLLIVQAKIADKTAADGLVQILQIPLRVGGGGALPLPLEPFFIHFEDPEYNRRLVSQTARASQLVATREGGRSSTRGVALASDRREYNPASLITLRHDWEDNRRISDAATLTVTGVVEQEQTIEATVQNLATGLSEGDLLVLDKNNASWLFNILALRSDATSTTITLPKVNTIVVGTVLHYGGAWSLTTTISDLGSNGETQTLILNPRINNLQAGDLLLVEAAGKVNQLVEVEALIGSAPAVQARGVLAKGSVVRYAQAYLVLRRIEPSGIVTPLGAFAVRAGQLLQASLSELQRLNNLQLRPGDLLEARLLVREASEPNSTRRSYKPIIVQTNIVSEPVIPTPEAAYGLLRRQRAGEVECVRFAWSPAASRIELISADDLRGELVRRRAVFQWRDAARPGSAVAYALQKIARNGATNIPLEAAFVPPD